MMNCPHCKNPLPKGLTVCYRCGEPLEAPAGSIRPDTRVDQPVAPETYTEPPETVCPHCGSGLPDGLRACLRCGKPAGNKKRLNGIIAAAAVVLFLCGAVGGHYLGLYSLPLLPAASGNGENTRPGTAGDHNGTQPEASGTPGASASPITGPSDNGGAETMSSGRDILMPDGSMLKAYSCTDYSSEYQWGPQEYNPDAVGSCNIRLTLTGDTGNVGAVWTWTWSETMFDDAEIAAAAAQAVSVWKENPVVFGEFAGNIGSGHPIFAEDFGKTHYVLLFVLDKDMEALGYIAVRTAVPSTAGFAGSGGGAQGNMTLRYDLPHIEIYVNESNPLNGRIKLKDLDIPQTVTLGLYDLETQSGWQEAHFGVMFASNNDYAYEVAIHQAAGLARLKGQFGYTELKGEFAMMEMDTGVWEQDIYNGHGQGHDIGYAELVEATSGSLTWEFTLYGGMKVDLGNLLHIGYSVCIYDDVREEQTYKFSNGTWAYAGDYGLDYYLRDNQ